MKHRLLGVVFIALLVSALTASVLQYRRTFTPVAWVTLHADRSGLQLSDGAEVKVRGVAVGDVRSIRSDGSGATVRLALNPAVTGRIPADVSARLLPKTLFGERYVELVPPAASSAGPIRNGAVISQDRSRTAIELERVVDDLLPLLQAIQPDKLAATLTAVANGLAGRGDQLGNNLVQLDAYLAELNREMPTITADVRTLTTVLDSYDAALPDLLDVLRNVTVTARTITEKQDQLANLLAVTTGTAEVTTDFVNQHGDQFIRLGSVSRPVLELLAEYAPEYPCVTAGLVNLQPRVEEVFAGGRMHITLEVTRDGGKYQKGRDEPDYGAHNGPQCRGLPQPGQPAPEVPVSNGYDYGANRPPTTLPVGTPASAPPAAASPSMGQAGTSAEQSLVKPLVGAVTGTPPAEVPDIAVLLWGPLLRGAVVNTR